MAKITKVAKIYLITDQLDKDGNEVDYKDIFKILHDLQYSTWKIKNKAVQLCWEWHNFTSDYYKANGAYPKDKETLGLTLSSYIYDRLKIESDLSTVNLSTSIQDVCKSFKDASEDMYKGRQSIISYKLSQPIDLHSRSIKLDHSDDKFLIKLTLLNKDSKAKYNFQNNCIQFKGIVKDDSTRTILERCIDEEYKICASKLIYDKRKKEWCLNLTYRFERETPNTYNLDKEKILGVDLGQVMPLCASVYGSKDRLKTNSKEIEEFRARVEARRSSLKSQAKECGNGRVGHGRKTRCKPANLIGDKIARYRDTKNHIYARMLINYAIENGCGTIQMEDLTGISENKEKDSNKANDKNNEQKKEAEEEKKTRNPFLKNWSYYDLQQKIISKAKESGIDVIKIKPFYTSQRCSKCGYIDKNNRKTQKDFLCLKCGFSANADYNASQNIAIKGIDDIISRSPKNK